VARHEDLLAQATGIESLEGKVSLPASHFNTFFRYHHHLD